MSKFLSLSLVIVSLIIGLGIGYVITPEYSKESMMRTNDLGKADEKYDLRFIDAMIEHHEGAIEMAEDAKSKSSREEIQKLSDEIIDAQEAEIEMMKQWKQSWYNIK